MRDRVLAWILQVRAGDRAAKMLSGLADTRQGPVEEALSRADPDPEGEIRRLRREEVEQLEARGKRWLGPAWREINPAVKRHAWRRVLDHVGENSQG